MRKYIIGQIKDSIAIKNMIFADQEIVNTVESIVKAIIQTYQAGGKLIFAGNGGSAADAQHLAGELVSRFYFDRPGLAAISLATDTSILTAIGNDYGYERVFSRQIEAIGEAGDVFIGISTSGNSQNILEAFKVANSLKIKTVGLSGYDGGKMMGIANLIIKIPSESTPRIQEAHIMIGHIICAMVEEAIFGKGFD